MWHLFYTMVENLLGKVFDYALQICFGHGIDSHDIDL